MLHLLGGRLYCRKTNTRWYAKLSMDVRYPLPPIGSCTGSLALFRGGRAAARSLCAFRLGFSRESATSGTYLRFVISDARCSDCCRCVPVLVRGRSWCGWCTRPYLMAAPKSDHGSMNDALHICLQTNCVPPEGALVSWYPGILDFWYSGALVVESCHASLCHVGLSV
jgi:hypothetical protein